jgi:hypothetical protein
VVLPDRRWRRTRQRRNRSSSWRCPALPMPSSLAAAQRWKSPAPIAGRQRAVMNQQAAQVFDSAVRPCGIEGGVAAGDAVPGQVPQGLALRRSHTTPLCGRRIDINPSASSPGGNLAPAAAAEAGGDAAAAGTGRLPGRVQARQRGEGAAAGAGAGAQPGLQVAVLADPAPPASYRRRRGSTAQRTQGGNRAGSGWRRRGRGMPGCYSSSRMRARSGRRPGLSSATAAADSPAVLRRAADSA